MDEQEFFLGHRWGPKRDGVDGAELGDVKSTENWMTWSHSFTENIASKEDVLGRLRLAAGISSGPERTELNAYIAKIEAVEDHRKLWVGPRNELRNTAVTTRVSLGDKALDNVKNLTDAKSWEMYEQNWVRDVSQIIQRRRGRRRNDAAFYGPNRDVGKERRSDDGEEEGHGCGQTSSSSLEDVQRAETQRFGAGGLGRAAW